MTMAHSTLEVLRASIAFAAGVALGLAYFATLARTLDLFVSGAPVAAIVLQAGRFLLAAAVMYAAAQFGALPLLSCVLGFLVGRHCVLRRVRKEG